MRAVGYWRDEWHGDYPEPQALVATDQDPGQLRRIADWLRRGEVFAAWRGLSFCRFDCGIADAHMGSRCLTDGVWVWPEGLAHYVEVHQLLLPDEFVERALRDAPIAGAVRAEVEPDDAFWIAWAADQGAVRRPGFRR
ncbi:hypothetical protein [Nannocystis pusilla]|uniref:Uncharacterized protein n=1 Tax=Nannocystis pusilla TaxID=889268 RepID=A0ABS7TQY5_9BACT|nr:hypothetical protein [Nannocystis pusilla]MBZ5710461.1 hypothetical protein [Nannocystis pusilla]